MDSQTLVIIFIINCIIGIVVFSWIYNWMKKVKQLLFGIMFLLNEQRKDEGKESNLQDIYNKGKNL